MKKLAAVAALLGLLATHLCAQEAKTNSPATNSLAGVTPVKIPASEAKDHIGAPAVVTGKIEEVSIAERLVRLNLDKPFPNQPFTAVIFATKTNLFADLPGLKGKCVEISGTIADYRGRPEIIIGSTNQLKVVDQTTTPAKAEAK